MYKYFKNLRCVRFNHFQRRFHTSNHVPSILSTTVDELTNHQIIYSFDTLSRSKVQDWNLWDHLCDKIRFSLDTFEVSELLKIVHSLAKVSYKKVPLLPVINRIILRKYKMMDSRSLTQYLIDLNKLDLLNINTFIPLVTTKVSEDLTSFSTFDLCFILHLCSKMQYKDQELIEKISPKLLLNESNYEELCSDKVLVAMVLRSLSFLKSKNELYSNLLYNRIPSYLYQFGSQELCNILLSIVVSQINQKLDGQVEEIVYSILDIINNKLSSLVEIEVNQLGICLYFIKHNCENFPEKYDKLLDSIVKLKMSYTPSTSKMQLKLGKLLDELRINYNSESQVGPYRLDYTIPKLKVAIEVNGYTHFFHNSKELNALTELKYKILRDLGWNVVGVNYYNWKNRNKQKDEEIKKISGMIKGNVKGHTWLPSSDFTCIAKIKMTKIRFLNFKT